VVLVYSATKGFAAMTLALAHSRGWLDYEKHVCTYWPEFGQNGKKMITVRQLLSHHAGLFACDEPVDRAIVADLDRLAAVMARQRPAWKPGARQAYHARRQVGFGASSLRKRCPKPDSCAILIGIHKMSLHRRWPIDGKWHRTYRFIGVAQPPAKGDAAWRSSVSPEFGRNKPGPDHCA
jgi:hypothetical protein